jgi:uncharacterized RDD family membrane protein YckC
VKETADVHILTPEHVAIRLVPAGLGRRYLAFLIDMFLALAVTNILMYLLTLVFMGGGEHATMMGRAIFILLLCGYHMYHDIRSQGRSLGKRVMKLRVVDRRGLPITIPQSFARNIARVIDMAPMFGVVGGVVCLLDPHQRRLGDMVADTLVLCETQPLEYKGQLTQVRHFNSLRTSRVKRFIRHRVTLEEREFLLTLCLRADTMGHQERFDLMEEVGEYYRKKLEVDDPHLSGEALVRDLTAILFERGEAEKETPAAAA